MCIDKVNLAAKHIHSADIILFLSVEIGGYIARPVSVGR